MVRVRRGVVFGVARGLDSDLWEGRFFFRLISNFMRKAGQTKISNFWSPLFKKLGPPRKNIGGWWVEVSPPLFRIQQVRTGSGSYPR